jgi:hypothetical protein
MEGAINYLRRLRDICKSQQTCESCELAKYCPFLVAPLDYTDEQTTEMVRAAADKKYIGA